MYAMKPTRCTAKRCPVNPERGFLSETPYDRDVSSEYALPQRLDGIALRLDAFRFDKRLFGSLHPDLMLQSPELPVNGGYRFSGLSRNQAQFAARFQQGDIAEIVGQFGILA